MRINQILRSLLMAVPLLSLIGCQPPTFVILAKIVNRNIIFEGHGPKTIISKIFGWDDSTIDVNYLEVVSDKEVLWAIQFDEKEKDCTKRVGDSEYTKPINANFPIAYGAVLKCFATLVAPHKIPVGVNLTVRSESMRDGSGHFRLEHRVQNFSWDELEPKPDSIALPTRNRSWMPIENPGANTANAAVIR